MAYVLSDYLDLTLREAEEQWREILRRAPVAEHQNQVDYVPVETLLCAAAMLAVDDTNYGSGLAKKGPSPIPELAALFRRRRTSITSKMANLEGGRPRGGKSDRVLWSTLSEDALRLFELYRIILAAARSVGVGPNELPDFLGIENAARFTLLGQDELDETVLEAVIREAFEADTRADMDDRPSEREVIGRARLAQDKFARAVLRNCGWACVFCGFSLEVEGPGSLLRASHIKPWRSSTNAERRDFRNGLAACPTHDAAFDAGDLTLEPDLTVVLSSRLRGARSHAVQTVFSPPLLRAKVVIPPGRALPRADYIRWHRMELFVG